MKRSFLLIFFLLILGHIAVAQKKASGLYLTQLDFENGTLSYFTKDPDQKIRINFHEFLDKPYITIKQGGEKTILFKDEIFAYRNKGKIVRTRDLVSYNFIEHGVIWIYYKDINVALGKGMKRERKYYFAVSPKDKILPLTIYNLKRSFPDKHKFHNFLDAQFRSDSELASFNSFANKFQVNHLLETTVFTPASTIP